MNRQGILGSRTLLLLLYNTIDSISTMTLKSLDFGHLDKTLAQKVFFSRVQECFSIWLYTYVHEVAESQEEVNLAKNLLKISKKNAYEIEEQLFCTPQTFQGNRLPSLKDTVFADAYNILCSRVLSDMQLPANLTDSQLDGLLELLFLYEEPDLVCEGGLFSTRTLLNGLLDRRFFSRSVYPEEINTLLQYLSSACSNGVAQRALERIYCQLLDEGVAKSSLTGLYEDIISLISRIPQLQANLDKFQNQYEVERREFENWLQQDQDRREQDNSANAHQLEKILATRDFQGIGKQHQPQNATQSQELLNWKREQLDNARHDLFSAENSLENAECALGDGIKKLLGEVPDNAGYEHLRQIKSQLVRDEITVFEAARRIEDYEVVQEFKLLAFNRTNFKLKPLELLFMLRLDQLLEVNTTRFEALSWAYFSVVFDFLRVQFLASAQDSLNRLYAGQIAKDKRQYRDVNFFDVQMAIGSIAPHIQPLTECDSISVHRLRNIVQVYSLDFDEVFEYFKAIFVVASGFFEVREGLFIRVGEGRAHLDILLNTLIYLLSEMKAKKYIGRVRKGLVCNDRFLQVAYEALHLSYDSSESALPSKDLNVGTSKYFKLLLGFYGRSVLVDDTKRKDIRSQDAEKVSVFYLHAPLRWRTWINSSKSILSILYESIIAACGASLRFVLVTTPVWAWLLILRLSKGAGKAGMRVGRFVMWGVARRWKSFWKSALGSWVKFFLWCFVFFLIFKGLVTGEWFFETWKLTEAKTVSEFLSALLKGIRKELGWMGEGL